MLSFYAATTKILENEMQLPLPIYDPSHESMEVTTLITSCLTQPCVEFSEGGCALSRPAGCFYYHSVAQRRRPVLGESNQILYWDAICPDLISDGKCERESICQYSHSKTELCYHPARFKTKLCNGFECRGSVCCFAHSVSELRAQASVLYGWESRIGPFAREGTKDEASVDSNQSTFRHHMGAPLTRFCSSYPNCENCGFGAQCPFAHELSELISPLLDPNDPEFYVKSFKTVWCIFSHHHDWNNCIYAHNNQDCRRPPEVGYGPLACSTWETSDPRLSYSDRCPQGLRCPYAHGRKEQLYHPAFYRTNECCDWRKLAVPSISPCIRGRICAFSHEPHERRCPPMTQFEYKNLLDEGIVNKLCKHLQDRPALVSAQPLRERNRKTPKVPEADQNPIEEDLDINDFVKFALN
jgi:hypothetical protein